MPSFGAMQFVHWTSCLLLTKGRCQGRTNTRAPKSDPHRKVMSVLNQAESRDECQPSRPMAQLRSLGVNNAYLV